MFVNVESNFQSIALVQYLLSIFTIILLYYIADIMTAGLPNHQEERVMEEIENQARTLHRNVRVRSYSGN